MVKYLINWEFFADRIGEANILPVLLENLFRETEIVFSVINEEKQTFGGMYELDDRRIVFVSNTFRSFKPQEFELADVPTRMTMISQLVSRCRIYPSFSVAFATLRTYKQDTAMYYEHRYVIDPLIKHLYQNKLVQPGEILN